MANETNTNLTFSCTKDGSTISAQVSMAETLVGSGKFSEEQTVGTSTEELTFPTDLRTEGITRITLKNIDATNFVKVGLNTPLTQVAFILAPGQMVSFKPYDDDPTYYALADTAACKVQKMAVGT